MSTIQNVYLETLGCDKNTIDSELMAGRILQEDTMRVTTRLEKADVVIVNTCCFIHDAKQQSIDAIFDLIYEKQKGTFQYLVVTGCLSEHYHEELQPLIPEIDGYLGPGQLDKIVDLLKALPYKEIPSYTGCIHSEYPETIRRAVPEGSVTAYLKISEGCNRHCTYCIIPQIRGKYRSRPMESIFEEARYLESKGVKELILIAQDLSEYGRDLPEQKSLANLLEVLARDYSFHWIRLLYMYPEGIDQKLLETMAQYKNICAYLDMPIQHTETEILRKMGRKITKGRLCDTIALIRQTLPDAVLRTTIITGFPGETKKDHQALMSTLKKLAFDRLGVFTFSAEEGTPAAGMTDQVPPEVALLRQREIYEQQKEILETKHNEKIGAEVEIIIEEQVSSDQYVGRTRGDAPDIDCLIYVKSTKPLKIGGFYTAMVLSFVEYDLIGEVKNESTE
ncbi:MAG: 30S ribosomal protein S12 methylthiotransferase RimO [Eubacteriaceae bacterium]|nr:30S ribosomal protein S12 methylthiotransferase RimO [Eubacteriaceae bacterium]